MTASECEVFVCAGECGPIVQHLDESQRSSAAAERRGIFGAGRFGDLRIHVGAGDGHGRHGLERRRRLHKRPRTRKPGSRRNKGDDQ